MDLSALSLTELRRPHTRINTEIRKRNNTAKRDLLKKMKKLAAEEGFSLNEVVAGKKPSSSAASATAAPKRATRASVKKKKLPPKYFHPDNPSIGWSGRGRKPHWVIDWTNQGRPLEELEKPRSS